MGARVTLTLKGASKATVTGVVAVSCPNFTIVATDDGREVTVPARRILFSTVHNDACLQNDSDRALENAVHILERVAIADPEDRLQLVTFAHALGLVLDRAAEFDDWPMWEALEFWGWTPHAVMDALHVLSLREWHAMAGAVRIAGPFFPREAIPAC